MKKSEELELEEKDKTKGKEDKNMVRFCRVSTHYRRVSGKGRKVRIRGFIRRCR